MSPLSFYYLQKTYGYFCKKLLLAIDGITFILMLFADDMVILGTPQDLQKDLDIIKVYFDK
jgi:hypothetical protein